jgi:putative restriction endonuclease
MDSDLIARISPDHRRRLEWFEERKGEITPFPKPIDGRLHLATAAKGILKPADLPCALSVRINLGSPYEDGTPVPTIGGGWLLSYHQEGAEGSDPDSEYANKGLMQCVTDRVPVGVLVQQSRGPSRYEVLGLAIPVKWADSRFYLESLDPPAVPSIDPVIDVLEAIAQAGLERDEADGPPIGDDYDARLRVYRQIVARQGQPAFRAALLAAYGGRCAITGCDATVALEAAHLLPYRGPESNAVTNGLLLRADVHTLFDLRLLAPDPDARTVAISKLLTGTEYGAVAGRRLAEPAGELLRPSRDALAIIWRRFVEAEVDR